LEAYSLCVSDAARQAAKVSMQETRIALPCMALVVEAHRLRAPVVLSQGGDSLIIAPIEDLAVQIGDQLVGPLYGTRFAVVVRTRSAAAHDVRFAVDVSRSIEASVRYVRQRELRNSVRSQALRRVEAMAEEADQGAAAPGLDAAVLDLLNRGLHALSECLPGASAYVALLQPGGEDLHYVASNAQSSMVGRHLERSPEAVSFLSMDADRVFIADEGVHCFCEAQPLPFICVPLAYEGHSIGILGADTFEHVSKVHEAEGEPPEAGVLDLLRAAAAALARGVDSRRKAAALKRVSAAATAEAMVDAGLDTLCRNVPFATIAEIWEMTEERDFRCVARRQSAHSGLAVDCAVRPVVVAFSPAALRARAERDAVAMPKSLARTATLDQLARAASHTSDPALPPSQRVKDAIVTEVAFGQLVHAALYAHWETDEKLRATVVGNAGSPFKRLAVPLDRSPRPALLVVTALRFDAVDAAFAVRLALTPETAPTTSGNAPDGEAKDPDSDDSSDS